MPLKTFKATVKRKKGLAVEAESRGFKIIGDEPEDLGGTNTGMNPVELLLSSLGSCQTIAVATFAQKQGIILKDFWVELEGDLETNGFLGLSDVRPGYQNIRVNMHIKTDASKEQVEKFIQFVEKHCPVGDSIGNGVKIDPAKITIEP